MKREMNIWVAGGDMRQAKLAQLLAEDGHTVHTYALAPEPEEIPGVIREEEPDQAGRADCLVLPLPVSLGQGLLNAPLAPGRYPLSPLLDRLAPGQFLCGGMVDRDTRAMAQARGLTLYDYFTREELAVANAVPTALAV